MSSKTSSVRRPSSIVTATAEACSVIENLQARLSGEAQSTTPEIVASLPVTNEPEETEEELESQLQAYFARVNPTRNGPQPGPSGRGQLMDELRIRVVDGVADRILSEWSSPERGMSPNKSLGGELIDRLIQRILEQLRKPAELSNVALTT